MKIEKEISFWAKAFYESLEENPSKSEEIFSNLKSSLGKKSIYLDNILKKAELIRKKEKTAKVFISHDFENKEDLKDKIQEKFPEIDNLEYEVDQNLLAGFRLKTKDLLVKASFKDLLFKLKNKINGYSRTI
ncbi:MAG: F0F1 ATP synthase subunit delta [Candidatus Pacebacteria bacterium]|nr:F0F1 ATP synthase subunit delta [Candidatus Paceibacterota bacterium]